jgi:hypothetical protein
MNIRLYANPTTTPKSRRHIQAADKAAAVLARELGVTEDTMRRWKRQACRRRLSYPRAGWRPY